MLGKFVVSNGRSVATGENRVANRRQGRDLRGINKVYGPFGATQFILRALRANVCSLVWYSKYFVLRVYVSLSEIRLARVSSNVTSVLWSSI